MMFFWESDEYCTVPWIGMCRRLTIVIVLDTESFYTFSFPPVHHQQPGSTLSSGSPDEQSQEEH